MAVYTGFVHDQVLQLSDGIADNLKNKSIFFIKKLVKLKNLQAKETVVVKFVKYYIAGQSTNAALVKHAKKQK